MHGSASSSGGFKGSEAMASRNSSHRVNVKQASKRMLEWRSKLVLSTHCVCTHHGIRCWVGINPFDAGGSSQDGAVTGLVGEGERVCSEAAQGHSTMALSLHQDCLVVVSLEPLPLLCHVAASRGSPSPGKWLIYMSWKREVLIYWVFRGP